jgi:plastocyanin
MGPVTKSVIGVVSMLVFASGVAVPAAALPPISGLSTTTTMTNGSSTSTTSTTTPTNRFLRSRATVGGHDPVSVEVGSGAACPGGVIFCFTPATETVHVGDTVNWTNSSGVAHTVTRCSPSQCDGVSGGTGTDTSFTSMNLDVGGLVTHTFTGAGTYVYYCMIHGYATMHGTIVVQATTSATTTTSGSSATGASGAQTGTNAATSSNPSNMNHLASTGSAPLPLVLGIIFLFAGGALLIAARRHRRNASD